MDNNELMRRLDSDGATGLDMSPGDPVAAAAAKYIRELEAMNNKLVERSVGAMAIAEGDEGHEKIARDCPMLQAVSALRELADRFRRELDQVRRALDIEKGVVEFVYIPVRHMRERADKYEAKSERLEAAANKVLAAYMPQFPDSRTVDDCLVGLAAAVAGVSTGPRRPVCQHDIAKPRPSLTWLGSTPDISVNTFRWLCTVCDVHFDLPMPEAAPAVPA